MPKENIKYLEIQPGMFKNMSEDLVSGFFEGRHNYMTIRIYTAFGEISGATYVFVAKGWWFWRKVVYTTTSNPEEHMLAKHGDKYWKVDLAKIIKLDEQPAYRVVVDLLKE